MTLDNRERVVDAMEAYARMASTLRFSPLGHGQFLDDVPLTVPQMKALGLIACAGPVGHSGRELASRLGVGPSAVTPVVDRLVEHGFVSRHEDPVDRRILRVRATPGGIDALERVASLRREMLAEIVNQVDAEDLPHIE